jgi:hypothetical protein
MLEKNIALWLLLPLTTEEFKLEFFLGVKIWISNNNPFQCNLGYQVSLAGKGEWNKKGDYVGKAALEKMGAELKDGKKPYKLQLVGLELGGKPIEEYAPDFWLISPELYFEIARGSSDSSRTYSKI